MNREPTLSPSSSPISQPPPSSPPHSSSEPTPAVHFSDHGLLPNNGVAIATTTTFSDDTSHGNNGTDVDLEVGAKSDPYSLKAGFKSPRDMEMLRKRKRGKKLARYHRNQNNLINALLKPLEEHTSDAKDQEEASRLPVKIAIYASLLANFSLCVLQLYAAISSISLSLLATGIDSVFDIGSNVLLFWLHRKASKLDSNKWPVGGARLETIGNIIYGSLMGSVNLIVIVESVQSIITKKGGSDVKEFHAPSIIAVAAALGVKLLLFLYCFPLRKSSSQVAVLWEDHRNDLWINTFGILTSTGGSKLKWFIDPMGAIIISLGVMIAWGKTIREQFELLAGKSASHDFLQLLIYKAATFSEKIKKIDTVRAYHSGPDYFVEIDIVMDANIPLWLAHDIAEQLQYKIEVLPDVERAFVHIDHETSHVPEHRKPMKES